MSSAESDSDPEDNLVMGELEDNVEVKEDEMISSEDGDDKDQVDLDMTSGMKSEKDQDPYGLKKPMGKAGIIYLSTIPPGMNVKQVREYLSRFGEVKRSFLQPEKKSWKGIKRNQTFTEGWIEFRKRRHAKRAAEALNNKPVGGKKKKVYHDVLWNIKYLPGFQWVHLNERLAYERISKKQKLRAEISAAKRESDFFAKSVELNKRKKRKKAQSLGEEEAGTTQGEPATESSSVGESSVTKKGQGPKLETKKRKSKSSDGKPMKMSTESRVELFKSIFNRS